MHKCTLLFDSGYCSNIITYVQAKLKYGMSSSAETLETMINELLSEMGLIRLRDKMIGSSFLEKEEV